MGEFELIRKYFVRPDTLSRVPIGDDCAVLTPPPAGVENCFTTDMLVAGRHFLADVDPESLGHKALAVNLSDLAAMGATPQAFLLSLGLPAADEQWLEAFARGLFALADAHACTLIGGDTTRAPITVINIAALGTVRAGRGILRSGALPGHDLWVSGTLGDASAGLAALQGSNALAPAHREFCVQRLLRPAPRVALGLALGGIATSMLDLSDGMAGDLPHILTASGVAAQVEVRALPLSAALQTLLFEQAVKHAVAGGDDYELLFTAAPDARDTIAQLQDKIELPLTRIGHIDTGAAHVTWLQDGVPLAHEFAGFDHFR
ncbi:MAG: thiamine-monophosphate kinase [Pseudomonadota bacterium]